MSLAVSGLALLAFMLLNIPVAISILAASLIYFSMVDTIPFMILAQRAISGVESIPLLAVPFFVIAGAVMNYTGITRRLANFAELITGRLPGGLAQVVVVISTLMGGLSGSSLADAAMLSQMLYPEMKKRGYSPGFSANVIAASAQITPLIPPGIGMILYGFVGNVSIGKMFMAGIIPGLLTCVALMIMIHFVSKKRGYLPVRDKNPSAKELWAASKSAWLALILPIVIIGGIRQGIFTPTEAGAVAIVYALILGMVFYREMKFHHLKEAMRESVFTTASVMMIIAAGTAFGWIMTSQQVPQMATQWVTSMIHSPMLFLVVINVFLLILGMFMEGNVCIIILTPLLIPMANAYGINPIHFGMIFLFNLAVGTLTPPLGTVMFTACQITGVKIEEFLKEVLPFYLVLFICLLIITYVPAVSMWLPNLLIK